jgi:predicted aminopeptidase
LRSGAHGSLLVPLVVAALAATSCFHVDYIVQAAEGQLDLACRAESLERAAEDPDVDPHTKALLAEVPLIKRFAEEQGMVATTSYERFVPLDRDAVVYVVTAAPPLSLEPKTWWFPVVGSVPYVGWFDRAVAVHHAEELARDGWDVDVRGASAYSTLGWFEDAVLSTMIEDSDAAAGELANTILHESLHATLYIPNQSELNESLASFVADKLTPLWLAKRFGPGSPELSAYLEQEEHSAEILERLERAYRDLKALYASKKPRAQKLAEKERYLREVEAELGLARPLNNARLAGYDSYHGGDEALSGLLHACGTIPRLVRAAKTIRPSDFTEEQQSDLAPIAKKLAAACTRRGA